MIGARAPAGMLVALNKPYGRLSQFTPEPGSAWESLAGLGLPAGIYPIGRLDADSEGLLLLSDEPCWTQALHNPARRHPREYWVEIERIPGDEVLDRLSRGGVQLRDGPTLPARAQRLPGPPDLPPRPVPVRFRRAVPTAWLSLELTEGRNRQVRRMTAAVGHPTLRLVRVRIGGLRLAELGLRPGEWAQLRPDQAAAVLALGRTG